MKKVLICAYAGAGNFGDEAALSRIISSLDADITVISRDPESTAAFHGVRAVCFRDPPAIMKAMCESDFMIMGGGTLFQSRTSRRSLIWYSLLSQTAVLLGLPFAIYGGIDDASALTRRAVRTASALLLRDSRSIRLAESFGAGKRIIYAPDPVLLPLPSSGAEAISLRSCGAELIPPPPSGAELTTPPLSGAELTPGAKGGAELPGEPGIVSAPCAHDLRSLYAGSQIARRLSIAHTVLISHPGDISLCRRAAEICRADNCLYFEDFRDAGRLISRARGVISSRLHPCVSAYSQKIPFAAFSDDLKILSFAADAGVPEVAASFQSADEILRIFSGFDFSRLEEMKKRAAHGLHVLSDIVKGL